MTVLTSTGNVNLTSATNWSPSQIPVNGDDLILANGHTLTVDADLVLDSLTVNSSSTSRMVNSGASRTLTVTNGITYLGNAGTATLGAFFCNVSSGTFTVIAKHIANTNFARNLFYCSGGVLNLFGPGSSVNSDLFEVTPVTTTVQMLVNCQNCTVNTRGRVVFQNLANSAGAVVFSIGPNVTLNHEHSGLSVINTANSNSAFCSITGSGSVVTLTGDFEYQGRQNNFQWQRLASASTLNLNGNHYCSGTFDSALTAIIGVATPSGILNLTGSVYHIGTAKSNSVLVQNGTFNWINQSSTIPANRHCTISQTGGSCNFSGLELTVDGRFVGLFNSDPTTNAVTKATISGSGQAATNATNWPVITLPDPAPTLPPVNKVSVGEVYGYAASPLTGTGLIVDSGVLSTSLGLALTANNIATRTDVEDASVL